MATSWLSNVWSHPLGARIAYYPSLIYGLIHSSAERRWYDRIDDKVLLGALPLLSVAKKLICEENIGGVLTLNEHYETRMLCPTEQQWNQNNVKQLRIATVDYNNAPTMKQIENGLSFISSINDEKSVYIHCKAGRSRSAVVALCYVMKTYNMDCDSAINFVKNKRPHIILGSEHQRAIQEFYMHNIL